MPLLYLTGRLQHVTLLPSIRAGNACWLHLRRIIAMLLLTTSSTISDAFKAIVTRVIATSLDVRSRRHPPRTFPASFDFDVKIV